LPIALTCHEPNQAESGKLFCSQALFHPNRLDRTL
jgi:hypothetical protein